VIDCREFCILEIQTKMCSLSNNRLSTKERKHKGNPPDYMSFPPSYNLVLLCPPDHAKPEHALLALLRQDRSYRGPIKASMPRQKGGAGVRGKEKMEEGGKNGGGRLLLWDEVGARASIKRQVSGQWTVARKAWHPFPDAVPLSQIYLRGHRFQLQSQVRGHCN
jgi:hypothetical protein